MAITYKKKEYTLLKELVVPLEKEGQPKPLVETTSKKYKQQDLFEGEDTIIAGNKTATTLSTVSALEDDSFNVCPPVKQVYIKPPPPQNKIGLSMGVGIAGKMPGAVLSLDDNLWLAKSAIQKAYRRGDQTLFDYSFDMLAKSKEAAWLTRRAVILPAEENWMQTYKVGRIMNLIVNPVWKAGNYQYACDTMSKYLRQQAMFAKNKTADGIRATAEYIIHMSSIKAYECVDKYIKPYVSDLEMVLLQQMIDIEGAFLAGEKSLSKGMWEEIWRAVDEISPKGCKDPDLILRDQIGACYFRSKFGAMASDKTLLACICLLSMDAWKFGITSKFPVEEEIIPAQEDGWDVEANGWPWWIADMHTRQGKIAISSAAKKFGYPANVIKAAWFYEESAKCNQFTGSTTWWDIARTTSYFSKGYTELEVLVIWENVRPYVKKLVEKMMN